MDEQKETLLSEDIIPLEDDPENAISVPGKRLGAKNLLFLSVVLVLSVLTVVFLFRNLYPAKTPNVPEKDLSEVWNDEPDASVASTGDVSADNESVAEGDVSEEERVPEAPSEPTHGWVINSMGYTYLYNGIGVEQFNSSDATIAKYVNSIRALSQTAPDGSSVYCMPIPTRIGFLYREISSEIRKEDNFFNSSQQMFLDTVQEQLRDSVSFVNLYQPFFDAYQTGTELYFRTDKNWTADAAYLAYQQFCRMSGNLPITISAYEEAYIPDFLGCFYTATQSELMKASPDVFRYYRNTDTAACKVTLYSGGMVYKNFRLADNLTNGTADAYAVYLGTEGAHFKIESPCTSGKKLLIVGDQSAAAMLPYLIANYTEIHLIDVARYQESFASIFATESYQDILFLSYVTNAVKGEYPAHLETMAGITQNG